MISQRDIDVQACSAPSSADAWAGAAAYDLTLVEGLEPRLLLSAGQALPGTSDFVQGLGWAVSRDSFLAPAPAPAGTDSSPLSAAAPLAFAPAGPPAGQAPYGATWQDTSEYMLGSVHVSLVLLESTGAADPNVENWTPAQIAQVKAEVQEGLTWWQDTLKATHPGTPHQLSFSLDTAYADAPLPTPYEPISRPSADQALWIDTFLNAVGYNSAGSIWDDLSRYNDAQRKASGTDWAYTIFVANSAADADGSFADGGFAYAYLGGPFVVMTSDNGNWGPSRMGQVTAHETGHVFYALDEYPGSGSYLSRSGYYNTQNLNAVDGHPNPAARVASIMGESSRQGIAYANHTSSPSSLQMIGWLDSDGDGVFDVLDAAPTLTGAGVYNPAGRAYTFSGTSAVQTVPNLNPSGSGRAVTINTVDRMEYRIDGGAWVAGSAYRSYSAAMTQTVSTAALAPGSHTIEFRTVSDASGIASHPLSYAFTVPAAGPGGAA